MTRTPPGDKANGKQTKNANREKVEDANGIRQSQCKSEGDRCRGSNWKNSQQLYANEVFLKLPKSAAKCRQKKEKRKEKRREHEKRRNQRKFLSCFDSLNLGVMLFRFGIHHNLLE